MAASKSTKRPAVAVIGAGYWGRNLVRNFQELGSLRLICDKNETLLEQFQNQYAETEICIAINEAIQRDDIQGVVVATPAETHFNIAREALAAKKHVFVEKPLVLEEEEGQELIELAIQNKRILMVGHLLQYHPVFLRLKELVIKGDLGRINYIYSHRLNLGKIRREENILWSFAPHDISMILSLAGEEPERIFATGGNYLHQKIADVTTTHLEFPSGLRAHIFVSWLHPFKDQKLVVVGDRKMAVFDDTQAWQNKLLLYPHQIKWQNNVPILDKAEAEKEDIPQSEPLRRECQHFLDCIQSNSRPITDGQEGLRVLRVLKASQHSLDSGGEVRAFEQFRKKSTAGQGYLAHRSAVIDANVIIGQGTKIWHFSHILSNSVIGEHCNIGQNVVIGPDVSIGKGCKIQNNVSIYKGVTLEDAVFCGPSMVFTNIYNPRAEIPKMDQVRPTLVKTGATIGANSTIICGVTLGRYCFIGAGAVVTRSVPDYGFVVGNPAKQLGWMCVCGERLPEDLECLSCQRQFERVSENVVREKNCKL